MDYGRPECLACQYPYKWGLAEKYNQSIFVLDMASDITPSMKMADLLERNPSLLGVFTRMGFTFGYGDATVADVCKAADTDPETFLLICRVYSQEDYRPSPEELEKADLSVIDRYLSLSHSHYMNVAMKDLAAGLGRMIVPCTDETQRVIWKFFSDFKEELRKHFAYEEQLVFPMVGSPDADISEEVKRLTGGKGASFALEASGVPALVKQMLQSVKKEGLAVLVSFVSGPVEIDTTMLFVGPCISFAGTVEGASNPPIFIPQLVQFFKEGKFPVDKLATYYAFEDIHKAMEDARSGKAIKPILLF